MSVFIGATGGHASPFAGVGYVSMLLPAVAVLVVKAATNEAPDIDWSRWSPAYLPFAVFLIPITMHAAMLPAMVALNGSIPWQDWLAPRADGLFHTPELRGWGAVTIGGLIARMLVNAVIGLVVVSLLALFEEIGWRAWLLPRLARQFGARSAVVAVSVIWALWHVPFQLSGIQHIDGASPLGLVLTLPVGTAAAGLILGWLWLRTESIWLVAIAHGSMNNWGQYAFKFMKDSVDPSRDLIVLHAASAALLCVGALLLWRAGDRWAAAHPS